MKLKCLRLINRNQLEVGKVVSLCHCRVCANCSISLCVCLVGRCALNPGCACGYLFHRLNAFVSGSKRHLRCSFNHTNSIIGKWKIDAGTNAISNHWVHTYTNKFWMNKWKKKRERESEIECWHNSNEVSLLAQNRVDRIVTKRKSKIKHCAQLFCQRLQPHSTRQLDLQSTMIGDDDDDADDDNAMVMIWKLNEIFSHFRTLICIFFRSVLGLWVVADALEPCAMVTHYEWNAILCNK